MTPSGHSDSRTRRFRVSEEQEGLRVDKFLSNLIPELSRSAIKRLVEEGAVSTEGGAPSALKPKSKVKGGQIIRVIMPEPEPAEPEPQKIPINVLYEDDSIIVIDKQAGLVVHPGSGQPDGTLVNALLYHCKDLSGIGGVKRPGIIHRLDKDTTGLMVVAKSDVAHMGLSAQFKEREIRKRYLAICRGIPADRSGIVDEPIGRDPFVRVKMSVNHASGRQAKTGWRLVRALFGAALLEVELFTGRTHQIRVHMSHLGHPLLGDTTYRGPRSVRTPGGDIVEIGRQMLHSWRLEFSHPVTAEAMSFEAEIPSDMARLIKDLEAPQGQEVR